jgi:DNA mismatch endonuclease (patch repair protein)
MTQHPRWRASRVPDEILRAPAGRQASAVEQDTAAGGRDRRTISLPDGAQATVSVYLHCAKGSRRAYAYARFKHGGRNHRRYVGEVSAETRSEALETAWRLIRQKGLLKSLAEEITPARRR